MAAFGSPATARRLWISCSGEGRARARAPARPRAVILDLNLPKVSGVEVLREMKADPNLRTIPVVIFSSSREEKDLGAAYGLGANSYVVKPVDFQRFTDTVGQLGSYWLQLNEPAG